MNEENVVTLPSAEEIMKRLNEVDMGGVGDYMAEYFYPLIAQEAGRKLNASGLVGMLAQKTDELVRLLGYSPEMAVILYLQVPKLIGVLAGGKVAEEAKRLYEKAMKEATKGKG